MRREQLTRGATPAGRRSVATGRSSPRWALQGKVATLPDVAHQPLSRRRLEGRRKPAPRLRTLWRGEARNWHRSWARAARRETSTGPRPPTETLRETGRWASWPQRSSLHGSGGKSGSAGSSWVSVSSTGRAEPSNAGAAEPDPPVSRASEAGGQDDMPSSCAVPLCWGDLDFLVRANDVARDSTNPSEVRAGPVGDVVLKCALVERPVRLLKHELRMITRELRRCARRVVVLPVGCTARDVVEVAHHAVGGDDVRAGRNQQMVGIEPRPTWRPYRGPSRG